LESKLHPFKEKSVGCSFNSFLHTPEVPYFPLQRQVAEVSKIDFCVTGKVKGIGRVQHAEINMTGDQNTLYEGLNCQSAC
jgi:hypothetical protein